MLFQIKNITSEYHTGQPVLTVDYLEIPRNKIVFIVGRSGIGKSTLIETMGLMNRTLRPDPSSSLLFFPDRAEGEGLELKNCWENNQDELAKFRRKHFSFIFQQTNLMPNFTAGENMMVSLLIKGRGRAEARRQVLQVMDRLRLSRGLFDKRIKDISGGQQQRLAFVRAVTTDFTVLFGDEPTGNLDELTAGELMGVLKDFTLTQDKSAVIVSHDLGLAAKFADIIIPITFLESPGGHRQGSIASEHIVRNQGRGWENTEGAIADVKTYLSSFLADNPMLQKA